MAGDHRITIDEIERAHGVIAEMVHRTPLLSSTTAATVTARTTGVRLADDRLYLKAEHLQKTGSFKPRGMVAKVASLTADERRRGIISFSAGNAGLGFAYAGAALGVPVTVVLPVGAVKSKAEACADYGARVVIEGTHVGETVAAMERIRDEEDLVFCHPFDDPAVIAGYGSIGLEILEDQPLIDVVVVGIGGGGLISGVAAALKQQRPEVRVYGVEPTVADALTQALAAGKPVQIEARSVADGLNAPFAGEWTLALIQRYVDDVIRIDDATILAGLRFALARMKQVVEPAGAAALAATMTGQIPIRAGERVAVVLSGGNVEVTRLGELIDRASPLP